MKARWFLCLFVVACGDNTSVNQTLQLAPLHLTTDEDRSVSATVTVTGGDAMVVLSATPPSHGTVAISGTTLMYTPDADFNGTDSLTVKATDGLLSAQATVDIAISAVNDAPVAVDDSFAGTEGVALPITSAMLLANDTDVDGDTLTVTGADNATHGTIAVVPGMVTFTPDAGFHAVATFDYEISDGTDTATGHASITFALNHPPVAVDDSFTTAEDTASVVTQAMLVQNDTDADNNTLSVQSVSNATHGSVALSVNNITFTPDGNFDGDGGYDYVVTDGTDTDTGHVTIHVTPVNDAPVAVDDSGTTAEDTPISISVATLVSNDTDADGDTLTISAVANATHGTATLNGANVDFVPAANFNGTAGYDYTVTDGNLTDIGHVTVTVTPVDDAPVAVDDTQTTIVNTELDVDASVLLANDTDVDSTNLTITLVGNAVNGTVTLTGTAIAFVPTADFIGAASFDYTVSDGTLTDVGTVTVNIVSVAVCGDGAITFPETCDDSNTADGDGCSSTCTVETGFTCTGTPSVCTAICGDGLILGTEACDDHNTASNDGCSSTCTVETGFTCTGEPSVCTTTCGDGIVAGTEECDDHNTTDGDGCSSTCKFELACLFTFTGAVGNEATFNADSSETGIALPVMSRGAGTANTATAGGAFTATSWNTAALDPTAFYSFTLTPDAGVTMNLLTFIFGDQKSGTGPTTWSVRSSLDSFATDIATSATHPAPLTANPIALPSAQFLGLVAPIEFRIFAFGASSSTGTWRIDNVKVVGFTQGP